MTDIETIKLLNRSDHKKIMESCCSCLGGVRKTTNSAFCMNPECAMDRVQVPRDMFEGKMETIKQKISSSNFNR